MKVIDPIKGLYSGKMNGMIFYVMNGRTYVKRAPDPTKKQERTAKQRGVNNRFRATQQAYRVFRAEVSPDIWRMAAQETGKSASNLFHSANCACFDAEGRLADPEGFLFSAGSLLLPREIAVEQLEAGRFRVTWTEERELATAAENDLLQVGVIPDGELLTLQPATTVSGRRGDMTGEFTLDAETTTKHIYVYFAREDGTAYSPSKHIGI